MTETIEDFGENSKGEIYYYTDTKPVREGQKNWEYSESDIEKGFKEGYYSFNPLPKMIESIEPEIRFIKRYISLKGKTKTKEEIYNFLLALQKSILKKEIRKTSRYAEEINNIQKQLIKAYSVMGNKNVVFDIEEKTFSKYSEIAKSEKVMLSVTYIRHYLNLLKNPTKKKAKKLALLIKHARLSGKIPSNCPYSKEMDFIQASLVEYIEKGNFYQLTEQKLRGLMGICECNGLGEGLGVLPTLVATAAGMVIGKHLDNMQEKNKNSYYDKNVEIMSSHDIVNREFETLGFKGKWKDLIGDPSPNFTMMIYGPPKCKKSTLAILFANYLAANHGKVLYAAFEEGIGETLKEKITRLNAAHENLIMSNSLPKDLSPYKFVFIDSTNRAKLKYNDLIDLRKQYPKIAFIYIFQITKDGNYRGSQEIEHDVDVVIRCNENHVAHSNGRFAQGGEMEI
jgi:hypothetical protein